eukprot:CAMPEP_0184493480 /NCGR_PEP_ID=MMETSP0113_2-20130426/26103_1 /TAXON_ID=91329 /ORGANISM="Norrisiella sphaerica, Strain BC52" /LENGTH=1136 /DNA_ID=CAMNT_0026878743 /DNA_START=114 /DNA_END=3524 /DNA_ORIENTATION=+
MESKGPPKLDRKSSIFNFLLEEQAKKRKELDQDANGKNPATLQAELKELDGKIDSFYTKEALEIRAQLRFHKGIKETMLKFWDLYDRDDEGRLYRTPYLEIHQLLALVFVPMWSPEIAFRIAIKDWNHDIKYYASKTEEGLPFLDVVTYCDSLFELADLWCDSIEVDDYIELLDASYTKLLELMKERGIPVKQQPLYGEVEQIKCVSRFSKDFTPRNVEENLNLDLDELKGSDGQGDDQGDDQGEDQGEGEGEIGSNEDVKAPGSHNLRDLQKGSESHQGIEKKVIGTGHAGSHQKVSARGNGGERRALLGLIAGEDTKGEIEGLSKSVQQKITAMSSPTRRRDASFVKWKDVARIVGMANVAMPVTLRTERKESAHVEKKEKEEERVVKQRSQPEKKLPFDLKLVQKKLSPTRQPLEMSNIVNLGLKDPIDLVEVKKQENEASRTPSPKIEVKVEEKKKENVEASVTVPKSKFVRRPGRQPRPKRPGKPPRSPLTEKRKKNINLFSMLQNKLDAMDIKEPIEEEEQELTIEMHSNISNKPNPNSFVSGFGVGELKLSNELLLSKAGRIVRRNSNPSSKRAPGEGGAAHGLALPIKPGTASPRYKYFQTEVKKSSVGVKSHAFQNGQGSLNGPNVPYIRPPSDADILDDLVSDKTRVQTSELLKESYTNRRVHDECDIEKSVIPKEDVLSQFSQIRKLIDKMKEENKAIEAEQAQLIRSFRKENAEKRKDTAPLLSPTRIPKVDNASSMTFSSSVATDSSSSRETFLRRAVMSRGRTAYMDRIVKEATRTSGARRQVPSHSEDLKSCVLSKCDVRYKGMPSDDCSPDHQISRPQSIKGAIESPGERFPGRNTRVPQLKAVNRIYEAASSSAPERRQHGSQQRPGRDGRMRRGSKESQSRKDKVKNRSTSRYLKLQQLCNQDLYFSGQTPMRGRSHMERKDEAALNAESTTPKSNGTFSSARAPAAADTSRRFPRSRTTPFRMPRTGRRVRKEGSGKLQLKDLEASTGCSKILKEAQKIVKAASKEAGGGTMARYIEKVSTPRVVQTRNPGLAMRATYASPIASRPDSRGSMRVRSSITENFNVDETARAFPAIEIAPLKPRLVRLHLDEEDSIDRLQRSHAPRSAGSRAHTRFNSR